MAQWCYDPVASALMGVARFRLPYPQPDWERERLWNAFLVEAMGLMVRADEIFSKPAEQWGPDEDEFFKWAHSGLAALKKLEDGKSSPTH